MSTAIPLLPLRAFVECYRVNCTLPTATSVFLCHYLSSQKNTAMPWQMNLTICHFYQTNVNNRAYTRVGTLIVATIYLQLIQNRYMFRSFTVLQCSHQHCLQPVASDVEVVGYL